MSKKSLILNLQHVSLGILSSGRANLVFRVLTDIH